MVAAAISSTNKPQLNRADNWRRRTQAVGTDVGVVISSRTMTARPSTGASSRITRASRPAGLAGRRTWRAIPARWRRWQWAAARILHDRQGSVAVALAADPGVCGVGQPVQMQPPVNSTHAASTSAASTPGPPAIARCAARPAAPDDQPHYGKNSTDSPSSSAAAGAGRRTGNRVSSCRASAKARIMQPAVVEHQMRSASGRSAGGCGSTRRTALQTARSVAPACPANGATPMRMVPP